MSEVAGSALSLTLSRHFACTPGEVFDAWTGSAWGDWLPPRGATCKVTAIDPCVGGKFQAAMTMPDGRRFEVFGTYRDVQRPERLVFTWQGDFFGSSTLVTVTFRPDSGGTLMTLHQEGFDQEQVRAGYESGWDGEGGSFEKLAAFLKRETAHG